MWIPLGLAAATLISEDAATLSAALLVRAESLGGLEAVAAVAPGIWLGDLGLFAIGRLAGRIGMFERWIARRWTRDQLTAVASRLNGAAPMVILASRFVPGSRVPLYVVAGAARVSATVFMVTTAVAALVWTTAIVFAIGGL